MRAEFQPFIGPRPFAREHQDRFFGRKRETRELASLVIAHSIVLLYGQSGTGKTSLLNAGLIRRLEAEEGFVVLPVVRPGGKADQSGTEQTTASPYIYATLQTWSGSADSSAPPADNHLADYLARLPLECDEDGDPKPRLLIFDQLEEVFRDQIDARQEQREFFAQIGEVLQQARRTGSSGRVDTPAQPVPTRVLLSMREEYIAELDNYAELLPDRLRIHFRLERLREPAALEAVTGPLGLTTIAFAPGVAEKLVGDLREVRIEAGVGEARKAVNVLGEFVEPVQLQVVCERLVRDLPPGVSEITFDHLSMFGSVDTTLHEFYKDAVAFAARSSGVPQDDLERWCEENLITETGTRDVVHRGPTESQDIPNAAPDALVERLLLRREPRAGAEWYELTHDRLIGPIQSARAARERREAEERGAERVRQIFNLAGRLVAAVFLIIVLEFIFAAWYFGSQKPDCEGTLTCVWVFHTEPNEFGRRANLFGRPAVDGPMAYVPSVDGSVYAIDTSQPEQMIAFVRNGASRQPLWRFTTTDQIWSSPALSNGVLYVGSQSKSLFAVDARTGTSKWGFPTNAPIVGSPALADGIVYIGNFDNNLYAVSAETGDELWSFPTGGPLISSPAVADGLVYVGSNDFSVYAVDAQSGAQRWRYETEERVLSSPAVVDGVVYIGSHDHNVYAIDGATGDVRWKFPTGERVRSSPAVVDGVVYVGSYDNNVYAIDAETGTELWRFATNGWVVASPLVHNGVVYIGSDDRHFYAIDAASGQELGRLQADDVVQSFPAVIGDQIIFGSGDGTVYAVNQVPSSGAPLPSPALPATPGATPLVGTPGGATPVPPGQVVATPLAP
jgi:outer membrane protein assembly factor BamB